MIGKRGACKGRPGAGPGAGLGASKGRPEPDLALVASLALICGAAQASPLPTFDQVRAEWRSSQTLILDRRGTPVQTVRTDLHARRGAWLALRDVSPALRAAAIASEDQRFEEHAGVDWRAVAGAAIGRADAGSRRGASTITMQLAGLVDPDLALPRGGRSFATKLAQAAAALRLERTWTKDQILEAWLNLVPFRGEQVGVGAMAQALFDKAPSGLDGEESAIAAALLRAPNAAPALVGRRACGILQAQGRGAGCATVQGFAELILARTPAPSGADDEQLAPHFARQALAAAMRAARAAAPAAPASAPAATAAAPAATAAAPATLRTTLDAGTQRIARDALRAQLAELRDRQVEDGAVVVLDNATGDVLAWVGSSGELSRAAAVDAVLAPRQPGSTLKPFLYEQAIEQRWLTAASVLDDAPTRLFTPTGLYIPQNYDHDFKGPVSVRTALGSSLNVPAVRTVVMVTPERFARRLVTLGLPLARPGGYYGYSLALGSAEVNLLSLANAYRALARGGRTGAPRLLASDPAPAALPVMDPGAAWIVADILSDNGARVPTFGLDNALATRYWSAVKTGTSKDMRDNWCVGFSARYTVGVWVGNASGEPMHAVSGVSGAAPVWRTVMDALQRGTRTAGAPPRPAGLVGQPVEYAGRLEAARAEWFLPGTETSRVELASAAGAAPRAIVSPDDGSIVAIDPDIPPAVQRLRFEAAAPAPAGAAWRLDGKRLGAARPLAWMPWPGRHELALVDARGVALDSVRFEVRGAMAR